jgi:hypothetical protein
VNWLRDYAVGSHTREWLALAIIILLSFASCIASLKLVFWLLIRKRNTDKSEGEGESDRQYWGTHGE